MVSEKTGRKLGRASLAVVGVLLAHAVPAAVAQTASGWKGANGATWNNSANWANGIPGTNGANGLVRDLYFNDGNATGFATSNNDIAAGLGLFRVTFNPSAVTTTITGNAVEFYDFGGIGPQIQNNSGVAQNFNLAMKANDSTGSARFAISPGSGSLSFSGTLQLGTANNTALTVLATNPANGATNSGNVTFSNVISQGSGFTGSVVMSGSGVMTLSGANTFSGGVTVNSGTLLVGIASTTSGTTITNGALGTGNLTLNNGASLAMADATSRAIVVPQVNVAGTVTIGQPSGGTGALVVGGVWDMGNSARVINLAKAGSAYTTAGSSLHFSAPTNFTASQVQNGSVTFSSPNATSTAYSTVKFQTSTTFLNNAALTIDDGVRVWGGTGSFFAAGTGAPALTLNASAGKGGGVLQMGDNNGNAFNGGTTMRSPEVYSLSGGGTVSSSNSNAPAGTWVSASNLTINNGNGATFSGTISETGGLGVINLVKSGAGTQTLSGNNNFSGTTTISTGGTLKIGSGNALGTGQNGNGTIATYRNGSTVVSTGVSNTTTVNSGGVLDLNGQTVSGEGFSINGTGISSGGALINSAAGSATLTTTGVLNNVTIGNSGTWTTGALAAPPTVTVNNSGTGGSGFAATALVGLAAITAGGGTGYTTAPTVSISGGGGTGLVITTSLTSGVVNFTIANPGTGYTSLPTLSLVGGAGGSGASISAAALGVVGLNISSIGSGYTSAPTISIDSTGWATGATATATVPGLALAGASSIGGTGDITLSLPITGSAALTKVGNNALTLANDNSTTFTGTTTLSAGTLRVANTGALGGNTSTTALTLSGGTLSLETNSSINAVNTTVSGNTTINSGRATSGTQTVAHTLGTLSIGAQMLSIAPGSNLTANSAYGVTFGTTTLTAGATFDVANNGTGVGTLTLGAVGGAFSLTKQGAGRLVLNTASTRSTSAGSTTLTAGTLRIGDASALNTATTTPTFSLNGGTFSIALDVGATIGGAGAVSVGGTSTIELDRATAGAGVTNSFNQLSLGANTLSINAGSNVTSGTAGLTLTAATGSLNLTASGGILDVGSGVVVTSSGSIAGTFNFAKQGAGTLVMNAGSTGRNSGQTTLTAGRLQLGASGGLGTSATTLVLNGGTLALLVDSSVNAYPTTVGGTATIESGRATAGAGITHTLGTLTFSSAATLTLNAGANATSGTAGLTFGATTLNAAPTFSLGASTQLTLGAVTGNANTATITGSGNFAQTGAWGGTGGITFDSSFAGTATLNQANTFTGTVSVNGGTLQISSNAAALGAAGSGLSLGGGTLQIADSTGRTWTNANTTVSASSTIGSDRTTTGAGVTQTLGTLSIGTQTLTVNLGSATNVTSGTQQLTFGSTTLSGNPTFTVNNNTGGAAGVLTLGALSDGSTARTINKGGSGTLTVGTAATTLTSGTQVNITSGTLISSNANALGSGVTSVNVSGGATFNPTTSAQSIDGLAGSGAVTLGTSLTVGAGNASSTFGGTISGSNGLTKSGSGTLILTGANSYTTTTISAGTLQIGNGGTTGTLGSGNVTNSGSLVFNRSDNYGGAISNVISGAGSVTVSAGTLTLPVGNTFSGGLSLSSGATLNINNASALGGAAGTFTVGAAAFDNTSGNAITTSNYPQSWNGDFTFTGTNDLNLGTGAVTLSASRTVTVSGGTLTVGGIISGNTLSLTKAGAGTLSLSGNNGFNGGVLLNAGTLQVGTSAGALGAGGGVTLAGGTLRFADNTGRTWTNGNTIVNASGTIASDRTTAGAGVTQTLGTLSIGTQTLTVNLGSATNVTSGTQQLTFGATTLTGSPTFAINNNTNGAAAVLTLGAVTNGANSVTLTGNGNFTQTGVWGNGSGGITLGVSGGAAFSGVATLSQANTFSGGVTVNSGTLVAAVSTVGTGASSTGGGSVTSGAFGTGDLTLNDGVALAASGGGQYIAVANIKINGNVTFSNSTQSGRLSIEGALDLGGSSRTITLGRNSTGTGAPYASGLEVFRWGNVANSVLFVPTIFHSAGDGLVLTTNTGTAAIPSVVRTNFPPNFSGNTGLRLGDGVAYSSGNGAVFGTGTNSPALILDAPVSRGGGVLQLGDGINGGNAVVRNAQVYSLAGGGTVTASNTSGNAATGTLTINNGGGANFSGTITDGGSTGVVALTKSGGGTQILSGANTYSGGTTLSGGTLALNNASAIGTGTFTISSGTIDNTSGSAITLSTNNAQNWNGDFTFAGTNDLNVGTGAVTLSANRTVTTSAGTLTVGGVIGGAFNLAKAGSGTLTLTGSNTYGGTTTISAGTLQVGSGGTAGRLPSSSAVTNNGTLAFNRTDSYGGAVANVISGSGSVTVAGGALTLSGANTYAGATTITAGSLLVSGSLTGTGGAVTVSSGASLFTKGGGTSTSLSRSVVVNGTIAPGNDGSANTVGTVALGNGDLNLAGTAQFDLNTQSTSGGDLITGVDNLDLGGSIDFSFLGGGQVLNAYGTRWPLINYASRTGAALDSISLSGLPSLNNNWAWGLTESSNNGVLTLNLEVVPEPATIAAAALIGVQLLRRRRASL
jgi:autotransporter-associated beta strand protein